MVQLGMKQFVEQGWQMIHYWLIYIIVTVEDAEVPKFFRLLQKNTNSRLWTVNVMEYWIVCFKTQKQDLTIMFMKIAKDHFVKEGVE